MSHTAAEQKTERQDTDVGLQLAGKYLTFKLAEEEYGLEILKVQEIIQMQSVTKVPRTPSYVGGVINLRGKVIPVIDLREKLGLPAVENTEKTCIIVVQIGSKSGKIITGIIIDEVKEVLDIAASNIEETPDFGSSINTEFILGIGKIGQTVKILLDLDRVMDAGELATLENAAL